MKISANIAEKKLILCVKN